MPAHLHGRGSAHPCALAHPRRDLTLTRWPWSGTSIWSSGPASAQAKPAERDRRTSRAGRRGERSTPLGYPQLHTATGRPAVKVAVGAVVASQPVAAPAAIDRLP